MSLHVLEGGTDIAEMSFFAVEDLPDNLPDNEIVDDLAKESNLVRMPTGADGGYLLHLYVDSPIDENLCKYCDHEDTIESTFHTGSGKVAFGGTESAFQSFKPNPAIRTDTEVKPGKYKLRAYKTEYPEDLVETEIESAIGKEGLKIVNFPGTIILMSIVGSITCGVQGFVASPAWYMGIPLVILCSVIWYRKHIGTEEYVLFSQRKNEIELRFPSIVIELSSEYT